MPIIQNIRKKLNWNAKGKERTMQNAQNLLNIGFYENAFERTMGNDSIDKPAASPEIIEETNRNFDTFMPDVEILDIRVLLAGDGDARLEVDITDGQ